MIWTDQNHFGTTEGQGKGLQQSSNREYRALKRALPVFLFLEWETYIVHMTYEGKKLYQINPKFCLFVYFAIIQSTSRLFKGHQY